MIYFGIDGGTTKTHIKIYKDEELLAETFGKSTNIYIVGEDKGLDHLDTLITRALEKCDLHYSNIDKGCIGIPAANSDRVKKIYSDFFLKRMPQAEILIVSEAEISLTGVTGELEGIVLINGTGSLALARDKQGDIHKVGGYGYILGDEGSAYWMVREAIKRIIRIKEGRGSLDSSVLTQQLLDYFHLTKVRDFLNLFHKEFSQTNIAQAAPLITKAALENDKLATEIVAQSILCSIELVDCMLDKCPELQDSTLVLYGGVLNTDNIIGPSISARLEEKYPNLKIKPAKGKSVDGAIILARQYI